MSRPGLLVLALIALALLACAAPLAVYAGSLALFGLPHVLAELRYVDHRFGARWPRRRLQALLGLLGLLVLVRLAGLGHAGLDARLQGVLELSILALAVALAVPALLRERPGRSLAVLGGLLLLAFGVLRAPLATLVVLALLHNLTPVGFLAERLDGADRRRALRWCAVAFGLFPVAILAGTFDGPAALLGSRTAGLPLLPAGSLEENLAVFVPPFGLGPDLAVRLFAAAAFMQCLHYATVLHVLPRLVDGAGPATVLAWPDARRMTVVLLALGALFLAGFAWDFRLTRGVYGVFAAVHAWVEIPLLVAALGVAAGTPNARVRPA